MSKRSKNNISKLARMRKLSDSYVDYRGKKVKVSDERTSLILEAMGYKTDPLSLENSVKEIKQQRKQAGIPPVVVLRPHLATEIILKAQTAASKVSWYIKLEDGGDISGDSPLRLKASKKSNVDKLCKYRVALPSDIPEGYHQLTIEIGTEKYVTSLIQTPATSYQNEAIESGKKIWGSAIQLYTLRSKDNWGMGDFTDLGNLVTEMAENGADFVGLNPLHALYPISPEHASPYSPSNRSMINPLYVDPTKVSEFQNSAELQSWFNSEEIQKKLVNLREVAQVNYTGVSALKYHAFERMYVNFESEHLKNNSARAQKFNAFVRNGGDDLLKHCLFDSLLVHFKTQDINAWGWPKWPAAFQHLNSAEVQEFATHHKRDIDYHLYLQFIASEQIESIHQISINRGMALGIYRDLAVGADKGGSEIWSSPYTYCLDASVGAPPDSIGPIGQNWGLPPVDPVKLKETGYASFISLLRNNMTSCGALRIDHAMALFRLWWCPPGKTAAEGVYVEYPFEDLLGLLLLESQRNKCLIIAEDLGTVPDEVTVAFPRAELFSNKVFCFEFDKKNGCTKPEDYAFKALAIVANHDMPTLAAFWDMSDLDLRMSLGMFVSNDVFLDEKKGRTWCKKQIIKALVKEGQLTKLSGQKIAKSGGMTYELSEAIHLYLASSNSQIIAIQLEDIMLVHGPVNIPGTSDEFPNWRRKLNEPSTELFARKSIKEFCQKLANKRH